jgi:hypothetical protein
LYNQLPVSLYYGSLQKKLKINYYVSNCVN